MNARLENCCQASTANLNKKAWNRGGVSRTIAAVVRSKEGTFCEEKRFQILPNQTAMWQNPVIIDLVRNCQKNKKHVANLFRSPSSDVRSLHVRVGHTLDYLMFCPLTHMHRIMQLKICRYVRSMFDPYLCQNFSQIQCQQKHWPSTLISTWICSTSVRDEQGVATWRPLLHPLNLQRWVLNHCFGPWATCHVLAAGQKQQQRNGNLVAWTLMISAKKNANWENYEFISVEIMHTWKCDWIECLPQKNDIFPWIGTENVAERFPTELHMTLGMASKGKHLSPNCFQILGITKNIKKQCFS